MFCREFDLAHKTGANKSLQQPVHVSCGTQKGSTSSGTCDYDTYVGQSNTCTTQQQFQFVIISAQFTALQVVWVIRGRSVSAKVEKEDD